VRLSQHLFHEQDCLLLEQKACHFQTRILSPGIFLDSYLIRSKGSNSNLKCFEKTSNRNGMTLPGQDFEICVNAIAHNLVCSKKEDETERKRKVPEDIL